MKHAVKWMAVLLAVVVLTAASCAAFVDPQAAETAAPAPTEQSAEDLLEAAHPAKAPTLAEQMAGLPYTDPLYARRIELDTDAVAADGFEMDGKGIYQKMEDFPAAGTEALLEWDNAAQFFGKFTRTVYSSGDIAVAELISAFAVLHAGFTEEWGDPVLFLITTSNIEDYYDNSRGGARPFDSGSAEDIAEQNGSGWYSYHFIAKDGTEISCNLNIKPGSGGATGWLQYYFTQPGQGAPVQTPANQRLLPFSDPLYHTLEGVETDELRDMGFEPDGMFGHYTATLDYWGQPAEVSMGHDGNGYVSSVDYMFKMEDPQAAADVFERMLGELCGTLGLPDASDYREGDSPEDYSREDFIAAAQSGQEYGVELRWEFNGRRFYLWTYTGTNGWEHRVTYHYYRLD